MTKHPFVLVVEDDEWMSEQHERVLQQAGLHTQSVRHAFAAIDAMDARLPDVIILDLLLTGQNALTLLHEMQSHVDFSAIPVILCTNSAADVALDDVTPYGVRLILDKTIMYPDDLVSAVKKVLL